MAESDDRILLVMEAVRARSRGDWAAERRALDDIHLLDREEANR